MKTPTASSPKIDWSSLKSRLASALGRPSTEISSEKRITILRERARIAALPLAGSPSKDAHLDLVEFTLAHENYAIEQSLVGQVIRLESYTPLPGAPSFILGVTPWHGRALTIVDLKVFFELPREGITGLNKIIVLANGPHEFGLLADSVSGALRRIPLSDLQTLPANLSGVRAQFTRGVTPDRRLVLDARRLLPAPQFHPSSK